MCEYTGVLKLLFDWQTLAAGFLAIFAAVLASWATLHSAHKQIRGMEAQTANNKKFRVDEVQEERRSIVILVVTAMRCLVDEITPLATNTTRGVTMTTPDVSTPWLQMCFDKIKVLDGASIASYVKLASEIGKYRQSVGKQVSGYLTQQLQSIIDSANDVIRCCESYIGNNY
jgi:hypothetical protein